LLLDHKERNPVRKNRQ